MKMNRPLRKEIAAPRSNRKRAHSAEQQRPVNPLPSPPQRVNKHLQMTNKSQVRPVREATRKKTTKPTSESALRN